MFNLLIILFGAIMSMCFGQTTAQTANSGSYTSLPEVVRDFYSKDVMFQAQPRCKFLQFAKVKRDLQAVKGKSIVFVKYNNLSGGGSLAESDALTPQAMGATEVTISVTEQANSIQITELLLRTSLMDVIGDASKLLANNVAVVLDGQFRDTCLGTTNIVYAGGNTAPADMTTSNAVFDTRTVKDAVEVLASNNTPKFDGEYYVCIAHPKQLRQLRDDANWINANTYMGRRQLYTGEVGMYEGVIFIESTQMPHLNTADTVTDGYTGYVAAYSCQAVLFGENAYAWAVALDVELRDDGVVELGRKHTLGWYGIWGTGIIEEDNIVKILSAHAN